MANQPAANLRGFLTQLDAKAKKRFLAACHEFGISGNEAVQRFVAEVIDARKAGRDLAIVHLKGDGSRLPVPRPLPRPKPLP